MATSKRNAVGSRAISKFVTRQRWSCDSKSGQGRGVRWHELRQGIEPEQQSRVISRQPIVANCAVCMFPIFPVRTHKR